MFYDGKLWIGRNDQTAINLLPNMANRHGMIAGATGTGKTITLKVMAESFSDAGVPVFVSDIKGDLSGMSQTGTENDHISKMIANFGLADAGFKYQPYPTYYWDVFGKKGTPVRATVSDMGPLLLARIMDLNDTQEGVLNIIFHIADDQKMLLLDMKDLKAMVQYVGDHASDYKTEYGNISTASIGAIQRGLLKLEEEGGDVFFGEPALDINDWFKIDKDGRGFINVLNCEELFQQPSLYAAFLLWMLSELYELLPEAGDMDKPKIVFFFDEAHLLFKEATKELLNKVEQVVRLIRSKGVGVYFITQNPTDIPDSILSQLGNRVQHALRAYSPSDQKAVKVAAATFRPNPAFDTEQVITELGTGEALISCLDEKGAPMMVEKGNVLPPQSLMGPVSADVMNQMIASSDMGAKYNTAVDRESAYELLNAKANASAQAEADKAQADADAKAKEQADKEAQAAKAEADKAAKAAQAEAAKQAKEEAKAKAEAVKEAKAELREEERERKAREKQKNEVEKMAKSIITSAGRTAANSLIRGLLGSLKK